MKVNINVSVCKSDHRGKRANRGETSLNMQAHLYLNQFCSGLLILIVISFIFSYWLINISTIHFEVVQGSHQVVQF